MKIDANKFQFALAFSAHKSAKSFRRFTFIRTNPTPLAPPSWQPARSAGMPSAPVEPLSIYAVDDFPCLTELYAGLLGAIGYAVQTFHHRENALTALRRDKQMPALLITDYLGLSMPVNHFIQACRFIHPRLCILMASGFNEREMRFSGSRPDRFIQKPFTPDEFQRTVRVALHDLGSSGNPVDL